MKNEVSSWDQVATHEDVSRLRAEVKNIGAALGILWAVIICTVVIVALAFSGLAFAAETLTPVSPPTDWTGIGVAVLLAVFVVAILLYVQYLKRPGMQIGEEQIERLAELLHRKTHPPTPVIDSPLIYEGITFMDQKSMDEYKAAQAVIAAHKPKE